MKSTVVSFFTILCLLLMVFLVGFVSNVQLAEAGGTIYIRADGSVEPSTANITSSDNVTYTFTESNCDSIVIERDNIVVDGAGYTLQGAGNGTGIRLSERRNLTIKNVEIKSFQYGIQMNASSGSSISGNTMTDNCYGIELRFCSNNTLSENSLTSCRHDVGYGTTYGVLLYETSKTLASQNNITRNDYGILIRHSSNNNTISENNITNNTEGIVILLGPSDNAIVGNQIAYSFRGIMLNSPGEDNTFSKNKITDSDNAVWVLNTSNNTFSQNYLTDVRGFYFHQCNHNELYGNEISGGIGIWLTDHSSHNAIYENNINNSHVQLDDSFGNTIYRNNMTKCGATLVSSSNNNISGNHMSAISLWESNHNNILGNSMIGNDQYGIRLSESSGNTLRNNKMVDNHYNFYIYGQTPSDYVNDIDTSNTVDGRPIYYWIDKRDLFVPCGAGYVALINCSSVTVKNQTLVSNGQGILIVNTTDSTIIKNNVTNNWQGIHLSESSGNSIFENNIEANNGYGVGLKDSCYNKFYHNNFINNRKQVFIENSVPNVWDDGYPSGGNYWSDYNGSDANHDGIGDTDYLIDANNTDNYPLLGLFSDFNTTSGYHVQSVCNLSISDFQYNGTAIRFNVVGEDGSTGFCRIYIPAALMAPTYRVFINGTEVQSTILSCSNNTHSYLYFNYTHSTKEVVIVPEFPLALVLPSFMITALLVVIVYRRKHAKISVQTTI